MLCCSVLFVAIIQVGMVLFLLADTQVTASLKYCPASFSVFTAFLFIGIWVCLGVSYLWMK